MLASAKRKASQLSRTPEPTRPTAAEKWNKREPIDDAARIEFKKVLDACRSKLHSQVREANEEQAI
jgi:hypothetical protein